MATPDRIPTAALFGYGDVGCDALETLRAQGWDVRRVFTDQDPPDDWQRSLAALSQELGIPVCTSPAPSTWGGLLADEPPDLILSAYYRRLIPVSVLALAGRDALNIHGSLLPAYRGRAPVNWQLVNGETRGGVTIHRMTRLAERGPIVAAAPIDIPDSFSAFDLFMDVRSEARGLLAEVLQRLRRGPIEARRQGPGGRTWPRRTPAHGRFEWSWPARRIRNLVRAVTRPWPGAFGMFEGRRLNLWWCEQSDQPPLPPGRLRLLGKTILAGTGSSPLSLDDFTLEGLDSETSREVVWDLAGGRG